MKKIMITLLSIIVLVVMLIAGCIYIQVNKPYTEIINLNWSIKLPNSYKEIYSVDSGASFQGDGERYNIFEYKNIDDINVSLKWEDNKNQEVESAVIRILKDLNVSKENVPDFKSKYRYYIKQKHGSDKIYLLFVTNTRKLYVIEDIY